MAAFDGGPLDRPRPERNLTAAVIRRLSARLERADLKPGDRLPTERELMGAYGVSRPPMASSSSIPTNPAGISSRSRSLPSRWSS